MTNQSANHRYVTDRRSLLLGAASVLAVSVPGVRMALANETVLTVTRADGSQAGFSMADLAALPQRTFETDTPWLEGAAKFSGPLLRDVLAQAGLASNDIKAVALNDYAVSIPFSDARDHDVIVASHLNGAEMSVRDKGPLWVMYPFSDSPALKTETNYSRCIWQLNRLQAGSAA